ncbi:MAG: hypothetical protein ABJA60_13105 [Nitrosospira sp.]
MIDASISISGRIQAAVVVAIRALGGFGGIIRVVGIMARDSRPWLPANQGLYSVPRR